MNRTQNRNWYRTMTSKFKGQKIFHLLKESKNYSCPRCGKYPSEEYTVKKKPYPIYLNRWYSNEGNLNWHEIHKCKNCGTTFYYSNGV